MDHMIAAHDVEPQSIVSIRERHEQTEVPGFLQEAFPELFRRIAILGVSPAGPPFVIYHEFGTEEIDAEVCVPVVQAVSATGRIQTRVLPEMTVARTLHIGSYEELGVAYAGLSDWIGRNGFEAAGPVRERYLNGPADGIAPSEYRTEIEMPIVRLATGVPA